MMNLSVKIGAQTFPNPVTVASGTFKYVEKYANRRTLRSLGAIVPKTITLEPRQGNPAPRIVETPAGMINAIGLEGEGGDSFCQNDLPKLKKIKAPLIVSLSGRTDKEFLLLAEKVVAAGVQGLELNLSCPNLGHKTLVAQDAQAIARVVRQVKAIVSVPVIAKLSPNVTDISLMALAAQDAGADAVSLVNTFSAMAIDIEKRRSKIGNFTGGLSGPAIRPIAVNMVYQTAQKVNIPIIGMGGIMTASDALEFLIAGATMVAVGTGSFVNPHAPMDVLQGIKQYMKKNKINDVKEIIGSLKRG